MSGTHQSPHTGQASCPVWESCFQMTTKPDDSHTGWFPYRMTPIPDDSHTGWLPYRTTKLACFIFDKNIVLYIRPANIATCPVWESFIVGVVRYGSRPVCETSFWPFPTPDIRYVGTDCTSILHVGILNFGGIEPGVLQSWILYLNSVRTVSHKVCIKIKRPFSKGNSI